MTKFDRNPFDSLMHFTCVGMGYCGWSRDGERRHVTDRIPEEGTVTADEFVDWVLWADFSNPDLVPDDHKRDLRQMFVKLMGGEVADAQRLRYD